MLTVSRHFCLSQKAVQHSRTVSWVVEDLPQLFELVKCLQVDHALVFTGRMPQRPVTALC